MSATLAKIARYPGVMLNHLEMVHRPGEQALAISFLETLGFSVADYRLVSNSGEAILFVHLEKSDPDKINNIFYLSQVRPEQTRLETALAGASGARPDLQAAIDGYVETALTNPQVIPHAGIRYQSFASLEATVTRLEAACGGELKGRVAITVVRPGDARSLSPNVIQAFVHTDLVVCGLFCIGQLFELQGQRAPGE